MKIIPVPITYYLNERLFLFFTSVKEEWGRPRPPPLGRGVERERGDDDSDILFTRWSVFLRASLIADTYSYSDPSLPAPLPFAVSLCFPYLSGGNTPSSHSPLPPFFLHCSLLKHHKASCLTSMYSQNDPKKNGTFHIMQ